MCDHNTTSTNIDNMSAALIDAFPGGRRLVTLASEVRGSRRYRLWELPANTHCPLIGVCLPMPVLRRVVGKALGSALEADDYEFHVAAVAECAHRMPLSEALQRELDRRYAITLRRFAQAKTTAALTAMWDEALQGTDVAGALWATLSHARCDDDLREKITRDIHMFQHQVGAFNRADLKRLDELKEENAALTRELALLQERSARMLAQRVAEVEQLNAELMRMRGQLIARDSALAAVQEELSAQRSSVPDLPARSYLARRLEVQQQRILELDSARAAWEQHAARETEHVQQLERELATLRKQAAQDIGTCHTNREESSGSKCSVRGKSVLCVGGRPASVPSYRQIIECSGGRFLHHDGGEENSPAQLESVLGAADLVICQTGCVSHGAYWRVKDHCKRTGKRCLFVDKPSASSLARCLDALDSEAGDELEKNG